MKLTQEDIEEFKKIYREEFGDELSDAEASEMAGRVLRLYELLAQPLAADNQPNLEKSAASGTMDSTHVDCKDRPWP